MYSLLSVFFRAIAQLSRSLQINTIAERGPSSVHNQIGVIQIPESGIPLVSFLLFTGRR